MNVERSRGGAAVGNAIIWAAVMLAGAMVTRGSEGSEQLLMIMVAGWFASSLLFYKKR